jgi:hypothetical protein
MQPFFGHLASPGPPPPPPPVKGIVPRDEYFLEGFLQFFVSLLMK